MVVLLLLNLPFAQVWSKLLLIPRPYLYAGIMVFCGLGVYATSGQRFDLFLLLGIALVGFAMRRHDVPLAPLMIGLVLGPLFETSLRDGLLSADGDFGVFVAHPLPVAIYALLGVVLLVVAAGRLRARTAADV